MRNNVFVLGNPMELLDRAAVKLLPKLKKCFPHMNFVHLDPTEELPTKLDRDLIIIDTVIGIEKVTKFENLDQWKISPRTSVHDYDLPLMLGILKKLGKIKNITIIGIPQKGKQEIFLKDLRQYLQPSKFQKM